MKTRDRFNAILATADGRPAADVIREVVDLALNHPGAEGLLSRHPELLGHRALLTRIYHAYITQMEEEEAALIVGQAPQGATRFREAVSPAGKMAYDRVGDMFDHIDLSGDGQFVMVGAGKLPVTAIHVSDRWPNKQILGIDVHPMAVKTAGDLARLFGLTQFESVEADGLSWDYGGADTVYVANMVSPKAAILERILDTAPVDVQIIVREPYSLGLLWAESGCDELDKRAEIVGCGGGSRYLSRDVFVRRRPEGSAPERPNPVP